MRLGFAPVIAPVIVPVIALCASPLAVAEWTVTDLLSLRSEVVETHASFIQDRYSVLLSEPLRSRGRLHYRAPGFLLQEFDAPFASRTVLDGETLLTWRDGEEVSMPLRRSGRVGVYARALCGVLGGRIGDIGDTLPDRPVGHRGALDAAPHPARRPVVKRWSKWSRWLPRSRTSKSVVAARSCAESRSGNPLPSVR